MLYSIVLKLRAEQETTLSPTQGYHGYALLLSLLNSVAPDLAHQVHSTEETKPITVSPLQGKFLKGRGKEIVVGKGSQYWLRFSFLEDKLFASFLHSMLGEGGTKEVQLESATFSLVEVATEPQQLPLGPV